MKNLGLLYAFLGGAIVGAGAAILFAPAKDFALFACRAFRPGGG